MDDLLLGLDLGTSRCKAVLVDPAGTEVAGVAAPTPFSLAGGSIEMAVVSLLATVSQLVASLGPRTRGVGGVGVAGMAECGAALDQAGAAIAPIIAWHDPRGGDVADRLQSIFGDALGLRSGQRPRPVSTIAKLGWLIGHRVGPVAGWLGVPELCLRELTGERATEHSLASRSGCYDVIERAWLEEVARAAGFSASVFAPVRAAGSVMGSVLPGAAERWGLRAGIPVTLAGHDHLAGMLGAGAGPGDLVNSVGTAETVVGGSPRAPDMARALELRVAISVAPGGASWVGMTGAIRAGLVLTAAAQELGHPLAELDALADTGAAASGSGISGSGAGSEPAAVGPWLTQLIEQAAGRPADPASTRPEGSPAAVWLGLLEALAARTAEAAGRVAAIAEARRMLVIGGGAASRPWLRAKRDAVPMPLLVARTGFASARGAAIQAGVAAGWWASPAAAPVPELDPVEGSG